MQTTFLSKKGFKELHSEINRLEAEVKQLSRKIRELGKVRAKEDRLWRSDLILAMEVAEEKLRSKREILKTAKPLPRKRDRLRVAIGSVVDLVDQQGRLFRYTLVDSLEANPSDGRISVESPLGQLLLDKERSEDVTWKLKDKSYNFQLVNIH